MARISEESTSCSTVATTVAPARACSSKVTLQEVLITAVRLGDSAEAPPSAESTLVYERITIEYRPPLPDGSLGQPVVGGWDVRANRRL